MDARFKDPRVLAVLAAGVALAIVTLTVGLPGPSWFVAGLWGTWAGFLLVSVKGTNQD